MLSVQPSSQIAANASVLHAEGSIETRNHHRAGAAMLRSATLAQVTMQELSQKTSTFKHKSCQHFHLSRYVF